jgi:hypothetical protein
LVQIAPGSDADVDVNVDVNVDVGNKVEAGSGIRTGPNRCDGAKVCRSGSAPGKQGMKPVVKSDRIPLRWTIPKHVCRWIVRDVNGIVIASEGERA